MKYDLENESIKNIQSFEVNDKNEIIMGKN